MENESQILLLLGEIKGQISGFVRDIADISKTKDDHEERIRALETTGSKHSGVVVGVTAVATAAASIIVFLTEHFHLFG